MTGLSLTDRRLVAQYVAATRNEIAIDERAFVTARLSPDQVGYLPRPTKWLRHAVRSPLATKLGSLALRVLWRPGVAALFFKLEHRHFVAHARAMRDQSLAIADLNTGVVLALSSRVAEVVRPPAITDAPPDWITMPWAPLEAPPPGIRTIDVFALLTPAQLERARRLAVASVAALHQRERTRKWVLQSYTAFRWFCVRLALDELDGEFVMAEHFDRWACLVDACVADKQRSAASSGNRPTSLTLIQHGVVAGLSQTSETPGLGIALPCRLRSVDRLKVYDEASAAIFLRDILSVTPAARRPIITTFQPLIELSPRIANSQPAILFVGHPLCGQFHARVRAELARRVDVAAYYKPHPMDGMLDQLRTHDWTVITGRTTFPDVDLLVSYPSTLVREYAGHGIDAVVHPMDCPLDNAAQVAADIANRLRSCATPRSA
jgi:hypothetical protein